jgi:peptide/nickel transport system ATP-binding protein
MLEVRNLKTTFQVNDHTVTAVDNVSFTVDKNQFVGVVGESGSGKSVTMLSLMDLLPHNGKIEQGQAIWKGQDLLALSTQERRQYMAKENAKMGLIFQNPMAALNPVFTIGNQMIETIQIHQKVDKSEAKSIAIELLRQVNIPDPEKRINTYSHELSLGMCQRVMVALTLAIQPALLIADEPTASLDVTIQAQMIDLIQSIRQSHQMSILMISHDLGLVAQHCDYIYVMYLGRIVESGTPEALFLSPKHPYTQALISSIPNPDPRVKTKPQLIQGDVPSPLNIPSGCRFHPRCSQAMPECSKITPQMKKIEENWVECLLYK